MNFCSNGICKLGGYLAKPLAITNLKNSLFARAPSNTPFCNK